MADKITKMMDKTNKMADKLKKMMDKLKKNDGQTNKLADMRLQLRGDGPSVHLYSACGVVVVVVVVVYKIFT